MMLCHNDRVRRQTASLPPIVEGLEQRCLMSAGAPDPTFGQPAMNPRGTPPGVVFTLKGASANAVKLQANGKILVEGSDLNGSLLVRYNHNGSLDSTFGKGGIDRLSFGPNTTIDSAFGLALLGDGKIVVTGTYVVRFGTHITFQTAVDRLNPNGSLDTTFGVAGIEQTTLPAMTQMSVQSNGDVLLCGTDPRTNFALVARLTTKGSLDPTFGKAGVARVAFPPSGSNQQYETFNFLAVQKDGKIVAGGNQLIAANSGDKDLPVVARLNANGTLDKMFNGGEPLVTNFGPFTIGVTPLVSLAVQADGKILAAGNSGTGAAVERLDSNGKLDTTFGTAGLTETRINASATIEAMALQTKGKLLLVGTVTADHQGQFLLMRYTGAGKLDRTFGTAGEVLSAVDNGFTTPNPNLFADAVANDVAVSGTGEIVTAGFAGETNEVTFAATSRIVVARYLGGLT